MEWKPEYAFVIFWVFIGTLYQFTHNDNEAKENLPTRIVSLLAATAIVSLLVSAVCMDWWNLPIMITGLVGAFLGIVGEKFLRLWLQYGNEAKGLRDFVRRMKGAYSMVKEDKDLPTDEKENRNET